MCEFCEGKVKASEMNPHLEDCEGFPLDYPNGCSIEGEDGVREVKRKDIPVHLDNHCPLHKIQCPYWDHGCKEGMERRHTDTHEKEFLHIHYRLSMTKAEMKHNDLIQLLTNRIAVLEKQNSDKDLQIASLTKTLTVVQPVVMNREIVSEKMLSYLLLHLVNCYCFSKSASSNNSTQYRKHILHPRQYFLNVCVQ